MENLQRNVQTLSLNVHKIKGRGPLLIFFIHLKVNDRIFCENCHQLKDKNYKTGDRIFLLNLDCLKYL